MSHSTKEVSGNKSGPQDRQDVILHPNSETSHGVTPVADSGKNHTVGLKNEELSKNKANEPAPIHGEASREGPSAVSAATSSAVASTSIHVEAKGVAAASESGVGFDPSVGSDEESVGRGANDTDDEVEEVGHSVRPGRLNQLQLRRLKQKLKEWEEWVDSTAKEF
ncbi:MAG TPA: hypothetical protein VGO47_10210 [Chlamydiales bacterium]|nr:hypothetical protein [Chlamydiales bacterium]